MSGMKTVSIFTLVRVVNESFRQLPDSKIIMIF